MITEKDINHFIWLHERIIEVYKESENTDYLIKMREIISNCLETAVVKERGK